MKSTFIFLKTIFLTLLLTGIRFTGLAQLPEFPVLDSLPVVDSLPEYQAKAFARRLAGQAASVRDILTRQAERATLEREVAADQLTEAEADTLSTKEERKILSKALKTVKKTEKQALKMAEKAEKAAVFASEVAELDSAELRKNIPKAYRDVAALIPEPKPEEEPIAEVIGIAAVSEPTDLAAAEQPDELTEEQVEEEAPAPPQKEQKTVRERPPIKSYNPAEDVMLNPPKRPCVLTVDTKDEFSGEMRREVQEEELFRFTNPSLRTYFPDREHIICRGALSTQNGTYVLHLYFTINDANAPRAFGKLPGNGIAILKFLDGETFTVYNIRTDEGTASADKKSYTYHGQYLLNSGMFKRMQKTYFDKIRIAWSTGYEDYEVYNVDFFMRQLRCMLKS